MNEYANLSPREIVDLIRDMVSYDPDLNASDAGATLIDQIVVPLWDAWQEANPPCRTCGGKGYVSDPPSDKTYEVAHPCPLCLCSGILPFVEWANGATDLYRRLTRPAPPFS